MGIYALQKFLYLHTFELYTFLCILMKNFIKNLRKKYVSQYLATWNDAHTRLSRYILKQHVEYAPTFNFKKYMHF